MYPLLNRSLFALRRCCGAAFFFGAPAILIAVACVVVALQPLWGPIDPENCDRGQLARLIQFRDFRTLSTPLVTELTERYDIEFGRRSGKMPEFQFSDTEKKIYAYYAGRRKSSGTRFETNLNLMARTKYFEWMGQFESLPSRKQPALMNEIIDDMQWWTDLYMDFLRAADQPIPSLDELMQDFVDMIESFKVSADADDVKRIDRFKQRMTAGFLARAMFKK